MESSNATRTRSRINSRERGIEEAARSRSRAAESGRWLDFCRALVKRTMDISIGLLLVVFLLPVMVLIAVAVKLDSRGPVLFRQRRIGLGRS